MEFEDEFELELVELFEDEFELELLELFEDELELLLLDELEEEFELLLLEELPATRNNCSCAVATGCRLCTSPVGNAACASPMPATAAPVSAEILKICFDIFGLCFATAKYRRSTRGRPQEKIISGDEIETGKLAAKDFSSV